MINRIVYTSFLLGASFASTEAQVSTPPNIVLILCDDMGFSDLGCYGSEIQTPNIDRLAENGVRFSLFKNTGRSCPSRAALLTGHYQHEAGMGWMTAVWWKSMRRMREIRIKDLAFLLKLSVKKPD